MDGNIPVLAKRNNRCCEHSIEAISRQAGSSQRDVCVSCWYNSFKLRACSAAWNRVRNFATGRKVYRDAPMTKVGTTLQARFQKAVSYVGDFKKCSCFRSELIESRGLQLFPSPSHA